MIEAIIAVALIALCATAVLAAVVTVQHQTNAAAPASTLTLSAQNVLTDLRAATAYDKASELAALAGASAAFDVVEPAPDGSPQQLHISVKITRADPASVSVASVNVRDAYGQTATVESALVQEAPAPASTVQADQPATDASPNPSGAISTDSPAIGSGTTPQPAACGSDTESCNRAHGPIAL